MHIGFFTDSYFPGIDGVTYTIKSWRERLEARGHEVSIIYPDSSHEPGPNEYPVPSLPNPLYTPYRLPIGRRLSTLPILISSTATGRRQQGCWVGGMRQNTIFDPSTPTTPRSRSI